MAVDSEDRLYILYRNSILVFDLVTTDQFTKFIILTSNLLQKLSASPILCKFSSFDSPYEPRIIKIRDDGRVGIICREKQYYYVY